MQEQLAKALEDRYRIERELGRGGMATVYLAEDLRHGHKTLPVFYASEDQDFFRELQKIRSMPSHEEVAPLLDRLQQSDALERTQQTVDLYIRRAILRLNHLPKSSAKRSLEEVARYVGKRKG